MQQVRRTFHLLNWQRWVSAVCIIILLLAIPGWIYWVAPDLTKIPDKFSYSANLLSVDNFFDEQANKFQGPQISKTQFSYTVIGKTSQYLIIKNIFDVRTLNNMPIISLARIYYINPYNGQHVIVPGLEQRSGYLFGPRFAGKNSFDYWHVNYDAPAHLNFIDKESVENLTVYHYQANYQADQTDNLTNLPGVPQTRGVKVDVTLQLWIEPVSGWLVKYQDNSLGYFYDRNTQQRLANWNQFSNQYTLNDIRQQVHKATELKWKILTIDVLVPLCLLIAAASLLAYNLRKSIVAPFKIKPLSSKFSKIFHMMFPMIISALLIGMAIGSVYYFFEDNTRESHYKIGISSWNSNPENLEIIAGFKQGLADYGFHDGETLKLMLRDPNSNIENQINIIQSFIAEPVDLIFTLTTPGTMVAKGITKKIPIVFSNVTYPVEANIIASLDNSQNNLVGTLDYISAAQQFNAFEKLVPGIKAIGFVHHKGDPDSQFQFQEYQQLLNARNIMILDIAAIDNNDIKQQLLQHKEYNALFTACDTMMQEEGGAAVAAFSLQNKIPNFSCDKDNVQKGALMGYVADPYEIGKLAGNKAALILRGADPDWLQTEALTEGHLIINLNTAKALGITLPPEILNKADTVQ